MSVGLFLVCGRGVIRGVVLGLGNVTRRDVD